MIPYDIYNREERALCARPFRLLHERLDQQAASPLGRFLAKLGESQPDFRNGTSVQQGANTENALIYCDAAIIRDAYHHTKADVFSFMDALTQLIMQQEKAADCRLYSMLPEPLNNVSKTHPKQIRQKPLVAGIAMNADESRVYGVMQAMFNAKPDLVIVLDRTLLVCEAKHTESFDELQLQRTWNIAEVWATLLYKDFGFEAPQLIPSSSWVPLLSAPTSTGRTLPRSQMRPTLLITAHA